MTPSTELSGLLAGRATPSEVNSIIHAAVTHARSYIRWLIWNRGYTITPLGMSLDDIAFDLIAELVSEIDGDNLQRLRNAINDVLAGENVDPESAFKAVVYRTVQVNLVRLFIEMHPVRARLLRSLRRYEKGHGDVTRHESLSGYWYAYTASDPKLELPSAPHEFLQSIVVSIAGHHHPVHAVLDQLLDGLAAYPEWRQAVSEDDLLDITLRLIQTDQVAAAPADTGTAADPELDELSIAGQVLDTLSELREWVFASYVRRSKLHDEEAAAMIAAIESYIHDLANGMDHGHLHYLQQRMPGLTQEFYRKHYRNTYEYIVRRVFTKARGRLQLYSERQDSETR